ncbi:MAG: hypothetical protein A2X99_05450 [Deltaproteobacteria bacterium GWB2_55_19]|nr:MAG: hypothetical protein A2X99_05450 [Deltaproteobacteria bacterium GWB2_55_19]HAO93575.1 transcriptional regulator [Deltaproteobacteria bacterium]
MNTRDEKVDHNSLLLLDEISRNKDLTQRDLSSSLGVALGLVNSYIKTLISKGYVTVSGIPRKRCTYYLTPSGFSEKARLSYRHLQNLTNLYRAARADFSALFKNIEATHSRRVVFCGADEITEIAYLSLKETGLELVAIADEKRSGEDFLGHRVASIGELVVMDFDLVVITSFQDGERLKKALVEAGIDEKKIADVNATGWLGRISARGA